MYQPSVVRKLPLAEANDPDRFVQVVREAGFQDVQLRQLPEIQALEVELAADPHVGDQVDTRMQYLITAQRPA